MKKALVLITIIAYSLKVQGQDYTDAGVILEMIGEHADMSEFFEKRDSSFQIEQFKLNEKKGKLYFTGGCTFSFWGSEIIQTCVYTKKPQSCKRNYWKWTVNEKGEKFGYIEECNKKGEIKYPNIDFKTITVNKIGLDSVIDQVTWFVTNKGDTTCHFINKWIYTHDTLIEYWHVWVSGHKCSWNEAPRYNIEKYSYPAPYTTITERFNATPSKMESRGKTETVKTYNESNRLTSVKFYWTDNMNKKFDGGEDRYLYKNGMWHKTERWYNGVLTETIIKTTANIK
ncbi:MAG: hypothetical protein Q8L90_02115 [Bacteroidota bacterium]|nr:hypothetical protein [Bacteroidota bacterium]